MNPEVPCSLSTIECRWSETQPPVRADLDTEFWHKAIWRRIYRQWNGEEANGCWETLFGVRWTSRFVYFAFHVPFIHLTMTNCPVLLSRTHQLWKKEDVVEIFIAPDINRLSRYDEFELSPSGQWINIELDQETGEKNFEWSSGMESWSIVDYSRKHWQAEFRIPLKAFEPVKIDAGIQVGLNAYRVELKSDLYMAWSPTYSLHPNFHIPEHFGRMIFSG